MKSKTLFTASAALLTMAILVTPVSAGNSTMAPIRLGFDKELVDSTVWEGTYWGDASGDVTVTLVGLRITGPIWHVEFEWVLTDDVDGLTLRAVVSGIINMNTGHIALNGVVTEGHYCGAQVHVDAQLEFDDYGSHGDFRIMTGSAA